MPAGLEPLLDEPEDPELSELFEPLSVELLELPELPPDEDELLSLLESLVVFFCVLL